MSRLVVYFLTLDVSPMDQLGNQATRCRQAAPDGPPGRRVHRRGPRRPGLRRRAAVRTGVRDIIDDMIRACGLLRGDPLVARLAAPGLDDGWRSLPVRLRRPCALFGPSLAGGLELLVLISAALRSSSATRSSRRAFSRSFAATAAACLRSRSRSHSRKAATCARAHSPAREDAPEGPQGTHPRSRLPPRTTSSRIPLGFNSRKRTPVEVNADQAQRRRLALHQRATNRMPLHVNAVRQHQRYQRLTRIRRRLRSKTTHSAHPALERATNRGRCPIKVKTPVTLPHGGVRTGRPEWLLSTFLHGALRCPPGCMPP